MPLEKDLPLCAKSENEMAFPTGVGKRMPLKVEQCSKRTGASSKSPASQTPKDHSNNVADTFTEHEQL